MIDERLFLSADLGDGAAGGGVDAGGAAEGAAVSPDGGTDAAAASQPFDYEGFAKEFGGPEGLKQAAMFAKDIHMRSNYNPQFKETLQRALNGEFGPQAQQQAQQQQGQQQQPQKPAPDRTAMQMFYKDLQRAQQSGDPEAVKAVFDDPMNAQAKEAYLAHQKARTDEWWDPDSAWEQRLNAPQTQQWMQQQFEQYATPIQQQMNHGLKTLWYSNNKQALDTLPQDIQQAFIGGFYGAGPDAPFTQWLEAVQRAVADAQKRAQQGVQPPTKNANDVRDVQTPAQPQNGQRPPQNKGGGKPEPSLRDAAKKYAKDLVAAKAKDNS